MILRFILRTVTRGLQTILLLTEASTIAQKQANGQSLTPMEQNFSNALATQMLHQQVATLNQAGKDFQTVQNNARPTGINLAGLINYGVAPPANLSAEVASFVPANSPGASTMFNNTATTSVRMFVALGQAQASANGNGSAISGGVALGATMAASMGAVVSGAATSTTIANTAAAAAGTTQALFPAAEAGVEAGAEGVADAAAAIGTADMAVTAAGPVGIVLAAAAMIAGGAVTVAAEDQFTDTVGKDEARANNQLAQRTPPSLATMLNQDGANAGLGLMLYCLTQMDTGTAVQTPSPVTS